jgi:hypothetical protein
MCFTEVCKVNNHLKSTLVREFERSPFAAIWRRIWTLFPAFSARHSPFFFFDDGTVLWNQGFGYIAFLQGVRSLSISWSLEARGVRVIYVSKVHHWDPPHEDDSLSDAQFVLLRERLTERFRATGETVSFR